MALNAAIVWEVRTAAGSSDNNGGGYKTGASGLDWSRQAAPQYALTTVTTAAANAICLDASAAADMVGNVCQIISGTNFTPGFYEIISVVDGVSFTLDRTCTTAAGALGVINIGGALASPGQAAKAATVSGHRIWVKNDGTYTLTTATAGPAGPVLFANAIDVMMEGYTTTRGDRAGRPSVSAGSITTISIFSGQGTATQVFIHMEANGNSGSAVDGFTINSLRHMFFDCVAKNCDQAGRAGFVCSSGVAVSCKASACTTGFSSTVNNRGPKRCWADACGVGFSITGATGGDITECLATDCTGDGFSITTTGTVVVGCTADGNDGDGFDLTNIVYLVGCAATNNTGFQFRTNASCHLDYCASWLNGKGTRVNTTPRADLNPILLTGDPWVAALSDDYRPNATAGAGAALRGIAGVGIPGQTDNHDVSAVQHSDPAGGGLLTHPGMSGGMRG